MNLSRAIPRPIAIGTRGLQLLLGAVVFLSSFLMFTLEPVVGKIVTPRFGGTAAVWSICLFFFQFAVLCGYGLAYWLSLRSFKKNMLIYLGLVVVSLFWAWLPAPRAWPSAGQGDPVWDLSCVLLKNVGPPALLLSTISSNIQVWYRNAGLGNPYPLYSVSNCGSFLALLAYPLLIEQHLPMGETLNFWGFGFLVLAGGIGFSAWLLNSRGQRWFPETGDNENQENEGLASRALKVFQWIGLTMLGSLVLLTQTAYLTSDIAPVPLLWIAPLGLYLITFILAFASPVLYRPFWCTHLWPIAALAEVSLGEAHLLARAGLSLLEVFLLCMICHGELAAVKPPPKHLPLFWFCTSIGGVLGGLLVSVVAPVVFDFDLERYATQAILLLLTGGIILKRRLHAFGYRPFTFCLVGFCSWALVVFSYSTALPAEDVVHRERNFYGSVEVKRHPLLQGLIHGQILHGLQYRDPQLAMQPLVYFGLPIRFVDTFLRQQAHGAPVDYAILGLGVGSMAAYGQKGDTIDFFEIDPKIVRIAREYFTFVPRCRARVNIIQGDGRTSIQNLPSSRKYDMIMMDAFNGDAIPIHLVTVEALKAYMQHLKPEGILLIHLSNRYVDLVPPVASAGKHLGLAPLLMERKNQTWHLILAPPVLVPKMRALYDDKSRQFQLLTFSELDPSGTPAWTDDFANLASTFRF